MLVASDYNFKSNEELSISIGILYTIIHYITLIKLSYILLTSNKLLKYHCACMHSFVCVCGRLESGNQTKLLMPLMSLFELHHMCMHSWHLLRSFMCARIVTCIVLVHEIDSKLAMDDQLVTLNLIRTTSIDVMSVY